MHVDVSSTAMIAPAPVPWPALVEQLPQFNRVLFFELSCPQHGDWRSAIPIDSKSRRLQCPRCGEIYRAAILARGLVRSPVPWSLVSPALKRHRSLALGKSRTGRPKTAEVTGRVVRVANMMCQGIPEVEIRRKLCMTSSHFKLFIQRRKTDVEAELRRITIGPAKQGMAQNGACNSA
jgi:hypothetical protein